MRANRQFRSAVFAVAGLAVLCIWVAISLSSRSISVAEHAPAARANSASQNPAASPTAVETQTSGSPKPADAPAVKSIDAGELVSEQSLQAKQALEELENHVRGLYLAAAGLRQRYGILDPDPESAGGAIGLEDAPGSIAAIEKKLPQQKASVEKIAVEVALGKDLPTERYVEAMGNFGIEDATTAKNLKSLRQLSVELQRRQAAGTPPNDERLAALQSQVKGFRDQLDEQVKSMRRVQQVKFETEKSTLADAVSVLEALKQPAKAVQEYIEAKAAYLAAKPQLEMAQARYIRGQSDRLIPLPSERVKDWRAPGAAPR